MTTDMTPVRPAAPVAPYRGGKRNLARHITAIIDAIPHTTYAEPFLGLGGVFLRRGLRPKCEVANDINGEIVNLFRILQRHYPQFMDCLKFQVSSRREFERLRHTDPATLTDLERAARFLYLQRTAFGGKTSGQNFGVSKDRPARFNFTTLEPDLEALHARLAGVVIGCLDYGAFLTRYDGSSTLFYLDPPYWGNETDYGKGLFHRDDFRRLADQLATLQGRFLLSINDVPETRETFSRFHITPVTTTYTIGRTNDTRGARAELLVSNFKIKTP